MVQERGSFDLELQWPSDRAESEVYASIVAALKQSPGLPGQVIQSVHDEYIQGLRLRYPRALFLEADARWQIDRQVAVFLDIVKAMTPAPVLETTTPRKSYIVAVALMAKWVFHAAFEETEDTPPAPRVLLELPDDIDAEALEQTVAAWCYNAHGDTSAFHDAVISGVQSGLLSKWYPSASTKRTDERMPSTPDDIQDAIQEGSQAVDYIIGGASPALVRHIVTTRTMPKEAERLFAVHTTAEKAAVISAVVRMFEKMKALHERISIPVFADWLDSQAGDNDLLAALHGHWLTAMHELLPILPPEMATAQLLPRGTRWLVTGWEAATTALSRNESRARRAWQRSAYSLDQPADSDGEPLSLHETHADPSAQFADSVEQKIDGILNGIALTTRQQDAAKLLAEGCTGAETAREMGISPQRVSTYKGQIRKAVEAARDAEH